MVAYRGFFPDSQPPSVAELQDLWSARLADPTAVVLLASSDGQPAGSVLAYADPQFGEGLIAGLHVLPSQWSQGIGAMLYDSAVNVLSEAGYRTAGAWVLAANERVRRMLERRGWILLPGVEQDENGAVEVRYQRELPTRTR